MRELLKKSQKYMFLKLVKTLTLKKIQKEKMILTLTLMVIQTLKTVKVLDKVQFLKQVLLKGKVLVSKVLKVQFRGNKESEAFQEDLQSLTCC